MSPEVTVCIPTYNSAHFLPFTVESVMRQGLSDFEILVVDNASTDKTEEVIMAMRNPRIRYVRNAVNIGSGANHNRCLELATGTYLKFVCADDVLLDGLLQKQLRILRDNQNVVLVSCNMIVTDENLVPQQNVTFFPGNAAGSRVVTACLSGMNNFIGGPTNVMLRRSAAEGVRFDLRYKWVTDLKFWLDYLRFGDYANIDELGYSYRRHANTDTQASAPHAIRTAEFMSLVEDFQAWNPINAVQAIRRARGMGFRKSFPHLLQMLSNSNPSVLASALRDVADMRNRNALTSL